LFANEDGYQAGALFHFGEKGFAVFGDSPGNDKLIGNQEC